MSIILFELDIPGQLPGLNEIIAAAKGAGGTGRGYSRMKRQWTESISLLAKNELKRNGPLCLPFADSLPFSDAVTLAFDWRERDKRRDPDNVAASKKLVIDGLVVAGVLQGDGWKWISGWTDHFRVDAKNPGVRVRVVA